MNMGPEEERINDELDARMKAHIKEADKTAAPSPKPRKVRKTLDDEQWRKELGEEEEEEEEEARKKKKRKRTREERRKEKQQLSDTDHHTPNNSTQPAQTPGYPSEDDGRWSVIPSFSRRAHWLAQQTGRKVVCWCRVANDRARFVRRTDLAATFLVANLDKSGHVGHGWRNG